MKIIKKTTIYSSFYGFSIKNFTKSFGVLFPYIISSIRFMIGISTFFPSINPLIDFRVYNPSIVVFLIYSFISFRLAPLPIKCPNEKFLLFGLVDVSNKSPKPAKEVIVSPSAPSPFINSFMS